MDNSQWSEQNSQDFIDYANDYVPDRNTQLEITGALIPTSLGLYEQLHWLEEAGFIDLDVYWLKAGHALHGGRKAG